MATAYEERIAQCIRTAQELADGDFTTDADTVNSELAYLTESLIDLGQYLETQYLEIEAISEVTRYANRGVPLDEILERIFETFFPIVPYERIGVALLSEDGKTVTAEWAKSSVSDLEIGKGYSARMSSGSLGRVLESGHPRVIDDLEEYLDQHPESSSTAAIIDEGMRSSLTCPLITEKGALGFIFFSSVRPHAYEGVHLAFFEQVAGQLALIIERAQLYERLVNLNEIKDRLLGAAAHDLRSPLTVIQGFADVMRADDQLTEMQGELLDYMAGETEHMTQILGDLLDVAAIEAGRIELNLETAPIRVLLEDRVRAHRILASPKGQTLSAELPDDLPNVDFDRRRVGQVLDNLLSNAVKYTEPDGDLKLRARTSKRFVTVEVIDNGQGIPAAELPKVFEEFVTTSARPTAGETSTGLGLAIAKRLIEAHGGTISVTSTEGVGTTFRFTLPVAA
ncbi:MAG: GAF domain-containing sensor histidine kinase [Acidimicrobiia bacterium]|nr:GAF domain-containing sensor histidine kinase [Acidimicrobiia bacterium]